MGINMELRHVIWNKAAGTRASLRSGTDVEGEHLASSQSSTSCQGSSVGSRSGLYARHFFLTTLYGPCFVHRTLSCRKKGVALVPIKGSLNATAYKDVLDEKGPHMGAITGCPHTIGHIVYTIQSCTILYSVVSKVLPKWDISNSGAPTQQDVAAGCDFEHFSFYTVLSILFDFICKEVITMDIGTKQLYRNPGIHLFIYFYFIPIHPR